MMHVRAMFWVIKDSNRTTDLRMSDMNEALKLH